MPLKALLDDQPFYAENLTNKNRKKDYRCPICKAKLTPVIPKKEIIKHFRHKKNIAHGEAETKEHREMKNYFCKKNRGVGFSIRC